MCPTYVCIEAIARNWHVLRTGVNSNNFAARTCANKALIAALHSPDISCSQDATQIWILAKHFLNYSTQHIGTQKITKFNGEVDIFPGCSDTPISNIRLLLAGFRKTRCFKAQPTGFFEFIALWALLGFSDFLFE